MASVISNCKRSCFFYLLRINTLSSKRISVTFARKDNSLRINRLVGLLENWVTRWQPFAFLSSSLLCFNVITLDGTKVQKEMQTKRE